MGSSKLSGQIQVASVSFSYGELAVLRDLNLTIGSGEVVAIIGPSGCGKTTLMNILSGYCLPASGTVTIQGKVRVIYQQGSLFPWLTVAENITIGSRTAGGSVHQAETIEELISLINMQGFENHYPYQLSGGMKQRVEIGRVLAGDADIIIMDEPFSSLDYQARVKMRRELLRVLQVKPKTVVLVTHDIEEAIQLADRVVVLSKRPSSVCEQICIPIPHPRPVTHPDLLKATEVVLENLDL